MEPRQDRLDRLDCFMLVALLVSKRSPDPNTQVGACVVNTDNRIVATGYNSWPKGIHAGMFPWERSAPDLLNTKYPYIVHAEKNAIHNTVSSLKGATIFTTLHPCNNCMQDIIQSGISKIFYLENKYSDTWEVKAAKKLATAVDIELCCFKFENLQSTIETVKGLNAILD